MKRLLSNTTPLWCLLGLAVANAASEMCVSETGVYTVKVDLFAGELGKWK